ncbi:hypothetical protein [Sutcliffiella rhizosphaerae]|uniref:Uncharacterized protein n=1 Tax=Sutcliffiella rhizosphaerae TaxID=2880967 RepID=A0ABN8AF15_9BACI|nr:hypothetical protein [Sutcliffiella rhizosphaerae]CAG9622784.1 hypothetical protein BACCIP111883_03575 [Sutcliffiella rhizosphaerae]
MDLATKGQIVHLKSKVVDLGLKVGEEWEHLHSPESWIEDISYI